MLDRAFRYLASASERKPWLVILIIALITAFFMAGTSRLKSEFGYKSMLPKGYESVQALNEVEELFGGISEEQVLLEADDVIRGDLLRQVAGYRDALRGRTDIWETFVTDIATPLDGMIYLPAPPSQIQANSQASSNSGGTNGGIARQFSEPLISVLDRLSDEQLMEQVRWNLEYSAAQASKTGIAGAVINISKDGRALMIADKLNPSLSMGEQMKLVGVLEDFNREYFGNLQGVNIYNSGAISLNRDSNQRTMKDTRLLFMLALIFILIVLFITFRRVSDILLTLMVILVTIIWVMGLGGWLNFPFTYTSSGIMPLMLGIDIAYAIHVLSRYYEERRKGDDPYQSATTSVVTVGVAVFLTAATTAFGFASFAISNMPPIVHFGMLCVAGVLFSFLLAVTLLPATLILRDRRSKAMNKWNEKERRMQEKWQASILDRILVKVAVLSEHHRAIVGLATLLILVGCVVLGTQIATEADMTKMMPKDMPSIVAMNKVNQYFGGQDMAYTLVKGDILEPETLNAMLRYEESISSCGYVNEEGEQLIQRSKVFSIADIVELNNGGTIPPTKPEVIDVLMEVQRKSGGGGSGNRLISEDLQTAMISVRVARGTQTDMANITRAIRDASQQAEAENPRISLSSSGMPVLLTDVMGSIVPTQLKTSGLALLLCALVVILVFRSIYFGLAATSVVFISIALEIGFLAILRWPLDFMTVMVSSLVIGAGIDFGIHVTHRFREEWHFGGVEIDEAIRRTVGNVGKALIAAAVTTAGAFAIISISPIAYMRRFGGITAISLVVALLASLLVLPSILAWRAVRLEKLRSKLPPKE